METPSLEHRRLKITTEVFPSNSTKLERLAASHPFTQQIDVVFPSSDLVEAAFSNLEHQYWKRKVTLSEIVDDAGPFADALLNAESGFSVLSANENDVWCIDPRGILTLSVSKNTYERLGLVGKKLPFKTHSDQHIITLPLKKNAESPANRKRRNASLEAWDKRRNQDELGPWDVLYCLNPKDASMPYKSDWGDAQVAKCQVTKSTDIHIPSFPPLTRHPTTSKSLTNDDEEDWNAEMASLFEWVGMAALGSQRLKANDRVDPYVSLYESPVPSYIGNVTHLRWTGFLGPGFIKSIIDTGLSTCCASFPASTSNRPFISITSHAYSSSPVSYISPSVNPEAVQASMRASRVGGEDTWCLLAVPGSSESQSVSWSIVESLGQWDTRWG